MGATQTNEPSGFVNHAMSVGISNQLVEVLRPVHPLPVPTVDSNPGKAAASGKKRKGNPGGQHSQDTIRHPIVGCDQRIATPTSPPGVSNCYVFKSRLQEYAQKVGLSTPVYETIKEGPSHEPSFTSTVVVGGVRYDSLPGFFNRKAAEQSAAEVALVELSKCGDKKESISVPVHETGLCKNLLQEYAQKMNYAIPTYLCRKDDTPGRSPHFSCTVEIGGVQYIGAAAKTKKEAEIKAARTALLAIQSSGSTGPEVGGKTQYTVVPCKRKVLETAPPLVETVKAKKPRKPRIRKKPRNARHLGNSDGQGQAGNLGTLVISMGSPVAIQHCQDASSDIQVPDKRLTQYLTNSDQDNISTTINQHNGEASAAGGPNLLISANCDVRQRSTASTCQRDADVNTVSLDSSIPSKDANSDHVVGNATSLIDAPTSRQLKALLSEFGTAEGRPAPAPTDKTQAGEERNYHSAGNEVSMVNAPTTGQSNALLSDFELNQGGPAPQTDAYHVREETNNYVGNVTAMVNGPTSGQLDALLPDSGMNQGGPLPLPTDTNHTGGENNEHVSPMVNPPSSRELDASLLDSSIQGDLVLAVADAQHAGEEYKTMIDA